MLIDENNLLGSPERPTPPAIRVHGRKRSHRLSNHSEQLMDELLPLLRVSFDAGRNPAALFAPALREVWLEIGFGDGGHLAWQAGANPDTGFIGCEPYVNGVAHLLEAIAADGLGNIRIHPGDARDLLAVLPGNSIARVYILFPDPWPRKRHHKRRFISRENLDAVARVLRPGGELRFASDSAEYVQWTRALLNDHPVFTRAEPELNETPATKYETKARAQGRASTRLRYVRN